MIQIEQAYFGEKNNQHQLLCSSFKNEELLSQLIPLSDKPAGLVSIQPYISGYYIKDYYVFTYTIADNIAKRQGLVFSHCLIIDKKTIGHINNLSPIFQAFVSKPEKETETIHSLFIDSGDFNKPLQTPQPNAYQSVIKLLLKDADTVVWPQYEGVENIIEHLWFGFQPTIRENFKFCLCDNPNYILDRDYTIVYTPSQNVSKWTKQKIVPLDAPNMLSNHAEFFLSGRGDDKFKQFIEKLEISIKHPSELNRVSDCFILYNELGANNSALFYNRLIRKIGAIAPNPTQGKSLKEKVFNAFLLSILSSDIDNILSIRSINLDPYTNGIKEISQSLSKWCSVNFIKNSADVEELSNFLSEFFEGKNPIWWQTEIQSSLKQNFKSLNSRNANILLNIWINNNKLVHLILQFIDKTESNEECIITNLDKGIHKNIIQNLIQLSSANNWSELHAICVYFLFSEKEAIQKQILFEKDLHSHKGLYRIIDKIGEAKFVNIAIELDIEIVHIIAGTLCSKNSGYLENIYLENINWQKVWHQSLLITNKIEFGIKKPQELIFSFFELIVADSKYIVEILPIIANSKYGNIYDYSQRQLLWNKLGSTLDVFLEKTSTQVVQEIFNINFISLENEIRDYLKSSTCQSLIYNGNNLPISNKLKYFELIGKLNENKLIEILTNKTSSIKISDSEYIGKLIYQKSWKNAADMIFSLKYKNYALENALNSCRTLLTWYKKIITPNTTTNFMSQTTPPTHSSTGKPKVFISYNHNDKDHASRINDKLKSEGFEVIIDEEAMKTGQKIEDFIKQSLRESAVTLSIVSENSLMSAWVAMETIHSTIGRETWGRSFMPCKIDDKIFDRKFPTEGIKKIELEITEINGLIKERMDMSSDFSDLSSEHARYTKLKNELPNIISNFKSSLCTDLSDQNFDKGIKKVIADLNG